MARLILFLLILLVTCSVFAIERDLIIHEQGATDTIAFADIDSITFTDTTFINIFLSGGSVNTIALSEVDSITKYVRSSGGNLFADPVALVDNNGQPIITEKSHGCPAVGDYNNDGLNDIVLGAKMDMDNATGSIWLIPNSGTNTAPVFNWADKYRITADGFLITIGCG